MKQLCISTIVCATLTLPNFAAAQIGPSITTPDKVEPASARSSSRTARRARRRSTKVYDTLDFMRGLDAFLNSLRGRIRVAHPQRLPGRRRAEQHGRSSSPS